MEERSHEWYEQKQKQCYKKSALLFGIVAALAIFIGLAYDDFIWLSAFWSKNWLDPGDLEGLSSVAIGARYVVAGLRIAVCLIWGLMLLSYFFAVWMLVSVSIVRMLYDDPNIW